MLAKERKQFIKKALEGVGLVGSALHGLQVPPTEKDFEEHVISTLSELSRSLNDWDRHLSEKLA